MAGRSSYHRIGRLATHPAFNTRVVALVCPYTVNDGCQAGPFGRVGEYDRHFIGHDPSARTAYRWLSGHTYDRLAAKRGWPVGDAALREFGDDTVPEQYRRPRTG